MRSWKASLAIVCLCLTTLVAGAEPAALPDISLPAPRMEGGKPLMQALKERQSTRTFRPEKLSVQVLSDLLWAATGVNRPDSGKRTVPSARDWQEIEVYAATEDGVYLYDPKANVLKAVVGGDQRKLTGIQDFVASAPLNLIYVADTTKMVVKTASGTVPATDSLDLYVGADTGFISQNVYLFCASDGLITVVRATVDRAVLAKTLNFPDTKRITLVQTVGYPEK